MFKKVIFKKVLVLSAILIIVSALSSLSFANQIDWEKYPEKDIDVIVCAGAGGPSDMTIQLIKPVLAEILGTNFVPIYKPGGTGVIAWSYLTIGREADGYTMAICALPGFVSNVVRRPEIEYDLEDVVTIANIITDPATLIVNYNSEIETFEDFVEYCKEHPSYVTVGDGGTGGDDWFATKLFEKHMDVSVISVPFKTETAAVQAVAGGHIFAASCNVGSIANLYEQKLVRPIVVFSEERSKYIPDIPSGKEVGIDIAAGSSRGFIARTGTPEKAIKILQDAIIKAMSDPRVVEMADKLALPIDIKTSEELAELMQQSFEQYEEIWDFIKTK